MVMIDPYFTSSKDAILSQNKAHSLLNSYPCTSSCTCPHTVKLSMQSRINKATCTCTWWSSFGHCHTHTLCNCQCHHHDHSPVKFSVHVQVCIHCKSSSVLFHSTSITNSAQIVHITTGRTINAHHNHIFIPSQG